MSDNRGFFGIGCLNMKKKDNYGTLFRTAQILGADFMFLIGPRFKRQASDTVKSWRHTPLFEYEDFNDFHKHRPYSSRLVGIELDPMAVPIKNYVHPQQAAYLLGSEDNGLSAGTLNFCNDVIVLPGDHSLNVSVAGSIVLFDRINKMSNRK